LSLYNGVPKKDLPFMLVSVTPTCNPYARLASKLKKIFQAQNTVYYEKLSSDAYQRNQWEYGKPLSVDSEAPPSYAELAKKSTADKSVSFNLTNKLTQNSVSHLSEYSLNSERLPLHIQFIKYPDGTYWTNCNWKGPLPAELDDPKRGWKGLFTYIGGTIWHSPVKHKSEKPKYVKYYHYKDGHLWTDSSHKGPMPIALIEKRTEQGLTKYMADGSIWTTNCPKPKSSIAREKEMYSKAKVLERISHGGGFYTEYLDNGTCIHARDT